MEVENDSRRLSSVLFFDAMEEDVDGADYSEDYASDGEVYGTPSSVWVCYPHTRTHTRTRAHAHAHLSQCGCLSYKYR